MPTLKEFLDDTYLPWLKAACRAGTTEASFKARVEFNDTPRDKLTARNLEKWRTKRLKAGQAFVYQYFRLNRGQWQLFTLLRNRCSWVLSRRRVLRSGCHVTPTVNRIQDGRI
jgi:hypothetical protein